MKVPKPNEIEEEGTKNDGEMGFRDRNTMPEQELPVPLVRIPLHQKLEDVG